jgi:hypothetical protein
MHVINRTNSELRESPSLLMLLVLVASQVAQLAVTESCSLIGEVYVCVPKTTAWFDSVIRKARTSIMACVFTFLYFRQSASVLKELRAPQFPAVYRHGGCQRYGLYFDLESKQTSSLPGDCLNTLFQFFYTLNSHFFGLGAPQ